MKFMYGNLNMHDSQKNLHIAKCAYKVNRDYHKKYASVFSRAESY